MKITTFYSGDIILSLLKKYRAESLNLSNHLYLFKGFVSTENS